MQTIVGSVGVEIAKVASSLERTITEPDTGNGVAGAESDLLSQQTIRPVSSPIYSVGRVRSFGQILVACCAARAWRHERSGELHITLHKEHWNIDTAGMCKARTNHGQ